MSRRCDPPRCFYRQWFFITCAAVYQKARQWTTNENPKCIVVVLYDTMQINVLQRGSTYGTALLSTAARFAPSIVGYICLRSMNIMAVVGVSVANRRWRIVMPSEVDCESCYFSYLYPLGPRSRAEM